MNNWPSEHRLALFLLVAVLAAAGAAFFMVVRPELSDVSDLRDEHEELVEKLKGKVKDTGYPLDATRLKAHVTTRKTVLEGVTRKRNDGTEYNNGLIARANSVLERATSMFDKQIRDEYTDIATFMIEVSNFVYQDELDQLSQELARKNVYLAEEVLGIGKDTVGVDTYELLIKVWTIKRILQVIVDDHGLVVENQRIAMQPGEGAARTPLGGFMRRRGRTASQITVLPTRSYVLYENDDEAYVQEFPIRIRFQGPLPTVCEAIEGLQEKGNFLTVNRFVLEQEEPKLMTTRKPGSDGKVRTRNVVVTLEIASFFRPSGGAGPIIRSDKAKPLPPGA